MARMGKSFEQHLSTKYQNIPEVKTEGDTQCVIRKGGACVRLCVLVCICLFLCKKLLEVWFVNHFLKAELFTAL